MSKDEELKRWLHFVTSLESLHDTASETQRRQFLDEFRFEFVLISYWLNSLRVTGTELSKATDPPEVCDLCGVDLFRNGLFIDGQIRDGRWSYMCMSCAAQHGIGIGWGVGQLYKIDKPQDGGAARWLCIAGGNPDPDRDASELMT